MWMLRMIWWHCQVNSLQGFDKKDKQFVFGQWFSHANPLPNAKWHELFVLLDWFAIITQESANHKFVRICKDIRIQEEFCDVANEACSLTKVVAIDTDIPCQPVNKRAWCCAAEPLDFHYGCHDIDQIRHVRDCRVSWSKNSVDFILTFRLSFWVQSH